MFTVIYRFEVKNNKQKEFVFAWKELTKLIYEFEGSLGSRIHHEKDNIYIAYAQWPSRKVWENFGANLPDIAKEHSANMKSACIKTETIHELEMLVDLLANQPFKAVKN